MKPDFALILSHDGIALVHRAKEGWTLLGEAALEGDDPMAEVAALRDKARAQAPRGFTSKLVLPDTQILYTAIYAPGPSPAQRKKQIEAALEGMTPYPVSELVYDFAGPGQTVQVAVIARETLKEAESFAQENGFNPVSFVAAPEPGDFPGEPQFGLTSSVAQYIPEGAHVEPDKSALIVAVDLSEEASETPAEAVPSEATETESAEVETAAAQSEMAELSDDSAVSETELAELSALDQPARAEATAEEADLTLPDEPGEFSELLDTAGAEPDAQQGAPSEDTPAAASPAAKAAEAVAAGEIAPEETEAADAVEFAEGEPDGALSDDAEAESAEETSDAALAAAGLAAAPALPTAAEADAKPEDVAHDAESDQSEALESDQDDDDLPKSDASVIAAAFASRRDHAATVTVNDTPPRLGGATRLSPMPDRSKIASGDAKITAPTLDFDEPDPRFTPKEPQKTGAKAGKATAPSARTGIGGTTALGAKSATSLLREEAKDGPDASTATPAPIVERTSDKTVFGGTKRPTTGGKPRHLGLMLTGALVLVLAIIALWTTLLDDPAPVDAPVDAIAEAPAPAAGDAPEQTALAPATPDVAAPEATQSDAQAQANQPAPQDEQVAALAPADAQPAPSEQSDAVTTAAPDTAAPAQDQAPTQSGADAQPSDTQPADTAAAEPPADAQATASDITASDTGDTAPDTMLNSQSETPDATADTQTDVAANDATASETAQSDATEAPATEAQTASPATPPAELPAFTATPLAPPSADTLQSDTQPPDTPPVTPTEDGVEMPGGFTLYAGAPAVTPGPRPEAVAQAYAATQPITPEGTLGAIPSLSGFRPADKPADLTGATAAPNETDPAPQADPNDQGALDPALQPNPELQTTRPTARPDAVTKLATTQAPASESAAVANPELAALRPPRRPASIQESVAAAVRAQDEAVAENADPFAGATALAVARSAVPPTKPRNFSRSVENALAAAIAAEPAQTAAAAARAPVATPVPDPRPADLDEPEPTAAPTRLPTSASVARQATEKNVINLRKINLIGLYGSSSNRRALVRLSNGRFVKVGVGDRLDGGRVTQIGSNALTYKKGSRSLTLKLLQEG